MSEIGLRFNAGVEYKENVYASSVYINGLFELNLITGQLRYIKKFEKEKVCFAIHRIAFLHGCEAWFIPQNGEYIAIINLETFSIQYIKPLFQQINEKAVEKINCVYYSGDIIEDRYLYLIPTNIDALLLIDMDTKELYPYYNISTPKEYFLYGTYVDHSIYLPPYTGRHLLKVDLKSNKRTRLPWEYPFGAYAELIAYHNRLWASPFDSSSLLGINMDTNEINKIPLESFYDSECKYEQIIIKHDLLFMIPFQSDKVLVFDIARNKLSQIVLGEELLKNGNNGATRIYSKDNLILACYKQNYLLIYENDKNSFREIKIHMEWHQLLKEMKDSTSDHNFYLEDFMHKNLYVFGNYCNENQIGLEQYITIHLKNETEKSAIKSENIIWKKVKEN
ncbi:MAG: hypothetical protein HFG52_13840 [Lachnospiraceae bacterium]|nr:hypothetical protein [Lachnospiraceae bacterium]